MINRVVNFRNEVLQYCMTNNHSFLTLPKKLKLNTVEVQGCTHNGDIVAQDENGNDVHVSYKFLGLHNTYRVFTDLFNHYCKSKKIS